MRISLLLVAGWTVLSAIGGWLLAVARYLFADGSGASNVVAFTLVIFVVGLLVNASLYSRHAYERLAEERVNKHYAQLEQIMAKEETTREHIEGHVSSVK